MKFDEVSLDPIPIAERMPLTDIAGQRRNIAALIAAAIIDVLANSDTFAQSHIRTVSDASCRMQSHFELYSNKKEHVPPRVIGTSREDSQSGSRKYAWSRVPHLTMMRLHKITHVAGPFVS